MYVYNIEKLPLMVIFLNNICIFGIHPKMVLYPKSCYNEQCYKEVYVYTPFLQCWKECSPVMSDVLLKIGMNRNLYCCVITKGVFCNEIMNFKILDLEIFLFLKSEAGAYFWKLDNASLCSCGRHIFLLFGEAGFVMST